VSDVLNPSLLNKSGSTQTDHQTDSRFCCPTHKPILRNLLPPRPTQRGGSVIPLSTDGAEFVPCSLTRRRPRGPDRRLSRSVCPQWTLRQPTYLHRRCRLQLLQSQPQMQPQLCRLTPQQQMPCRTLPLPLRALIWELQTSFPARCSCLPHIQTRLSPTAVFGSLPPAASGSANEEKRSPLHGTTFVSKSN
jgi:hypothetical protein